VSPIEIALALSLMSYAVLVARERRARPARARR